MSQRDVERTLGRLLTDPRFRREFFVDPPLACLNFGLELTPHELDALLQLPHRRLATFSELLDDRICRLDISDGGTLGR